MHIILLTSSFVLARRIEEQIWQYSVESMHLSLRLRYVIDSFYSLRCWVNSFMSTINQLCIVIRSRYHLGTVRFWYVYYQALILTISTNATKKLWVLISSRQNSQLLPFNQILVNIAKTHIPRSFGNAGFVSVCSAFFVSF